MAIAAIANVFESIPLILKSYLDQALHIYHFSHINDKINKFAGVTSTCSCTAALVPLNCPGAYNSPVLDIISLRARIAQEFSELTKDSEK